MAKVLKGKEVADKIKAGMKLSIEELKKEGRTPLLTIVRLGNNAGDVSYEKKYSQGM